MQMNLLKPFGTYIISKFRLRTSKVSVSSKDIRFLLAFNFYTLPTYNDCLRMFHEVLKPLRKDNNNANNSIIEWNGKRYRYTININHEVIRLLQHLYSEIETESKDNSVELMLKSLRITNIRIEINIDDGDITTATAIATKNNTAVITNKHELKHILTDAYFLLRYIESSVKESKYIAIRESLKYIILAVNGDDNNYTPIACIRDKGIPIIEQCDTDKKQWIMYMLVKDSKDVDAIVDCLFR